jgi:putative thioredoxin
MAIEVTDASFAREVIERSRTLPVVVDFWAAWCGPCRTLGPALEAAEAARAGKVVLAKVDVDANQALAARYGVQGIPAVKAFRDGAVASEFVGAVPRTTVEAFFDSLVPSRADELLAAGDELSLREAAELAPRRADIAVALARKRLERGAEAEALEAVDGYAGDFAAAGIAARVRLTRAGIGAEAFAALDRADGAAAGRGRDRGDGSTASAGPAPSEELGTALGPDRQAALDALLAELPAAGEDTREDLRRAIVGILSEADPADSAAREYRRRLSAALY